MEDHKEKQSLFGGWSYHLIDSQEKANHPERFKPELVNEDETGSYFHLKRKDEL